MWITSNPEFNFKRPLLALLKQPASCHPLPWWSWLGIVLRISSSREEFEELPCRQVKVLHLGLLKKQIASSSYITFSTYSHHQALHLALGINSAVLATISRSKMFSNGVFQNYVLSSSSWKWKIFLLEINNWRISAKTKQNKKTITKKPLSVWHYFLQWPKKLHFQGDPINIPWNWHTVENIALWSRP